MAVKITYANDSEYHPLYWKHDGASEPEIAYVYLDCEHRHLGADCGGGSGPREWNGHILTWSPREDSGHMSVLPGKEINKMLDEIAPLAEKLCDAYDTDWDGRNIIAKYPGTSGVQEKIVEIIESKVWCAWEGPDNNGGLAGPWDAGDWLGNIEKRTEDEDGNDVVEIDGYGTIRAETTDEQITAMTKQIEAEANDVGASVPDADDYLTETRNDLARQ